MSQSGSLYAGTAGFAFKEWKGSFYPEDLPDKKMLGFYSQKLGTVEINYTFRRVPSEQALRNWKEQAAEGFRFALKAPQRITHFKRLQDANEDVNEFVRLASLLDDRLGTILFQLPPTLRYDRSILEPFLASLPAAVRYAMEFRHESWKDQEPVELLAAHGVAYCGADTEEKPLEQPPVTAAHAYLRLRRTEYGEQEIRVWGAKIRGLLEKGIDVFCYFKHEGGGVGPAYALALERAVGERSAG
jgi:uncharacterized protein YecE (DUF72 family)